jgi:hypothetical protein
LSRVIERVGTKGAWLAGADPAHLRAYLRVYKTNVQADYRPLPQIDRVPIALFKAGSTRSDDVAPSGDLSALMQEPAWGWDRFSSLPVEVIPLPGDHLTLMLEPNVRILAERLNTLLKS